MAAKCVPWGIASSRLTEDVMPRMQRRRRHLRKPPRHYGVAGQTMASGLMFQGIPAYTVADIDAGPATSKVIEVWF